MHRIFQNFIDHLSSASNSDVLRDAMSQAAAGLDLSCFAYLSMPGKTRSPAELISNYPSAWTTYYLQSHYERFDPVIIQALGYPEPFEWGLELGLLATSKSQELLRRLRGLVFGTDLRFLASGLLRRVKREYVDVNPRRLRHGVENGGGHVFALKLLHVSQSLFDGFAKVG
jgi:Autoinducer binding domain